AHSTPLPAVAPSGGCKRGSAGHTRGSPGRGGAFLMRLDPMAHRSGPRRSNRLPCNQANCRSVRMSTPDTRQGEGGEERDCHLARPIAVWSNAPQRCNDGGLAGGHGGGKGWRERHNCIGRQGRWAQGRCLGRRPSPVTFLVHCLERWGDARKQWNLLVLGGPRLNRSQVHVFCGESAGMTRGSSIWHRLGRTLRRRASSIA